MKSQAFVSHLFVGVLSMNEKLVVVCSALLFFSIGLRISTNAYEDLDEASALNLKDLFIKEIYQIKKQVAMECAAIYPVDNSTIRQIMTHSGVPEQKEVKCWLSCVMKNMGIMVNGKIDWKKGAYLNKMVLESEEDKAKLDTISELCEKEVPQNEKDECQLAYYAAVCKFKYGKMMLLPPGFWED